MCIECDVHGVTARCTYISICVTFGTLKPPSFIDLSRAMGDNRHPTQHGLAEAGLDGHVRYTRRPLFESAGADGLRSGFGRNMGDSPMVIVWPSRDADGAFGATLSQRKVPYETMPKPDPKPPFVANLALSHTTVRLLTVFSRVSLIFFFVLCRSPKSTFRYRSPER